MVSKEGDTLVFWVLSQSNKDLVILTDWLIVVCLTSSNKYFMHTQRESQLDIR